MSTKIQKLYNFIEIMDTRVISSIYSMEILHLEVIFDLQLESL
jgi:hypothetical protein